jgi:hypothetical protein
MEAIEQTLFQALEEKFPDKQVLTLLDVTTFLECRPDVVRQWTKRMDPKRRPPRLLIGKEMRFLKKEFAGWLAREQASVR